jgi:hypothetical protein
VGPFGAADVAMLLRGWETHIHRLTVQPPIARRLGTATGADSAVLARIPVLLSHEAGVSRRPPGVSVGLDAASQPATRS